MDIVMQDALQEDIDELEADDDLFDDDSEHSFELTAFLEEMAAEREEWEEALADVPADRLEEPGAAGPWSVKDIIAHITWHEQEMVRLLDTRELEGSPWWLLPTEERNAHIYEENCERTLDNVMAEADAVYLQLVDALSSLDQQDLNDPSAFVGMPSDWNPGDILSQNTYLHYRAHADSVRAWLET